jgi:hypothetical protein
MRLATISRLWLSGKLRSPSRGKCSVTTNPLRIVTSVLRLIRSINLRNCCITGNVIYRHSCVSCIQLLHLLFTYRKTIKITSMEARTLLCVGDDADLMRTRSAVLCVHGYDAQWADTQSAEEVLKTGTFDLVILSSRLTEPERARERFATSRSRTLSIQGLIMPLELLKRVSCCLSPCPE